MAPAQAILLAVVVILVIVLAAVTWLCPSGLGLSGRPRERLTAREGLRATMHRLWFDHVDRTNIFILSALRKAADTSVQAAHLHENQDQIAAALGKYYGPATRAAAAKLLHEHIDIAGRLVVAHRDRRPTAALTAAWYRNADEISALLSRANRRWPYPAMRAMMRAHLDATAAYLAALLGRDWARAVRLHDRVVDQAIHMADALTDGIDVGRP
jgi:hypothetical protein